MEEKDIYSKNIDNMDLDKIIRKALYESIQAHAREWDPKFQTGNGPVGDDAPFDEKQVSEEEEKDCKNGVCCEQNVTPVSDDPADPNPDEGISAEGASVPQEPSAGLPETSDWNLAPEGGESEIGESDPFGLSKLMEYTDEENAMLQEENNRFQDIMGRISKLYD